MLKISYSVLIFYAFITLLLNSLKNCFTGSTIFKCLGHTYEVDNVVVYSYYLVMDKIAPTPNISNILVSNVTDGFIEMVVADSQVDGTEYLETKLQRCNENSRFNMTRYMKCSPFTSVWYSCLYVYYIREDCASSSNLTLLWQR